MVEAALLFNTETDGLFLRDSKYEQVHKNAKSQRFKTLSPLSPANHKNKGS